MQAFLTIAPEGTSVHHRPYLPFTETTTTTTKTDSWACWIASHSYQEEQIRHYGRGNRELSLPGTEPATPVEKFSRAT